MLNRFLGWLPSPHNKSPNEPTPNTPTITTGHCASEGCSCTEGAFEAQGLPAFQLICVRCSHQFQLHSLEVKTIPTAIVKPCHSDG